MVLQIVNAALVVAGQTISMSMGLVFSNVDPIWVRACHASFLVVMSTLIFLSIGGHLILIELVMMSFEVMPIGGSISVTGTLVNFTEWSGMVFLGAVLIALPIILTMMLINLCLGIVTRAAPALNIFAVGFPAMVLAGMLLLMVYLVNINLRIEWLWIEAFTMAQDIWVAS